MRWSRDILRYPEESPGSRKGYWVTPREGDLTESVTETKPP